MGTIYALDTEAFKFSEESKKQDKSICKEEYIKTYCMPEKIISYETTDGDNKNPRPLHALEESERKRDCERHIQNCLWR